MRIEDFLAKVAEHPHLELVRRDATVCELRQRGSGSERRIRLGLWAVERMCWERLAEGLGLAACAVDGGEDSFLPE